MKQIKQYGLKKFLMAVVVAFLIGFTLASIVSAISGLVLCGSAWECTRPIAATVESNGIGGKFVKNIAFCMFIVFITVTLYVLIDSMKRALLEACEIATMLASYSEQLEDYIRAHGLVVPEYDENYLVPDEEEEEEV